MYNRLISLPKNHSFFLFGQRGTGKTTLLKECWVTNDTLTIDLLDSQTYLELARAPWKLRSRVAGFPKVLIDEIQKIPLLLDEVHKLIEEEKVVFAMTGSSARKLKKAGVNMLAGRAFAYSLYPLSYRELGGAFDLLESCAWGTLPGAINLNDDNDRENFLYSYVDTYLKEEIILEQVVRQVEPFNRFLEVAAQINSENINYENIAKDASIGAGSVRNYFHILTDTLIGFFLPSYHTSKRKRQKTAPKFYFHDLGLVRALQNTLKITPQIGTYEFGKLFETFVINEIIKINEYTKSRFEFSHLRVDNRLEIDLIVERPGGKTMLIEIKSKDRVDERDAKALALFAPDFKNSEAFLLSRDRTRRQFGPVTCLYWRDGVDDIFKTHPTGQPC